MSDNKQHDANMTFAAIERQGNIFHSNTWKFNIAENKAKLGDFV